jgi:hypothetical protein
VLATSTCSSKVFLQQPLTVQTRQTRQVVRAIKQSIFKIRCLWCYLFVEAVLGLVLKDVEPGLGIEAGVVVPGFYDRGHVESISQGLQGLVPNVDGVPGRVLK